MKITLYKILLLLMLAGMVISACKKPYNPTIASSGSVLVIEGLINTGVDSTIIKLTRTAAISNVSKPKPELKAIITVEDNQNSIYPLTETANGNYVSASLGLNSTRSYRLRVKTADGAVYLSDFEIVKVSQPIDSVGYKITGNGLDIYANTHDATNSTTYYRWEYEETWRFHSKFQSIYISDGTQIVARPANKDIYECFSSDVSNNVIISSSASLQQDVIYQAPINSIPSESEKIETRYSILVKQYALTKAAYAFWTNLKKNTESLGSIFDAQPSQIAGNIHCISNPDLPVIGYISAGTITQKRIFIDRSVLPQQWISKYPYDCEKDSLYFSAPFTGENQVYNYLIKLPYQQLPIERMNAPTGAFIGYFGGTPQCADCTVRGRKQQPAFWK